MNAYNVVRDFEQAVAEYTGTPYAVAVESCSAALFLCCKMFKVKCVDVPRFTYPSVAASVVNAGGWCRFVDNDWQQKGWYMLSPYPIIDSAKRLEPKMYLPGDYTCLSFHGKKHLSIGRGGMILTDDKDAVEWFKCARFDGRHECALNKDVLSLPGWNMYMTPEQAARGLEKMQWLGDGGVLPPDPYLDLSRYEFFTRIPGGQ